MWPFKPKKSKADLAIQWMPRAIEVATLKWLEFVEQQFAQSMPLDEMIYIFTAGLTKGLREWEAYKSSPDALFLLIAAKGVERSRTHLRIEIEAALEMPLPAPYEMTDEEQTEALVTKIKNRVERNWCYFSNNLQFRDEVSLRSKIHTFRIPFLEGVRKDIPILRDASDDFFDPIIALGIADSGTNTLEETQLALGIEL